METGAAIVVGASGGIGQAMVARLIDEPGLSAVHAVTRGKPAVTTDSEPGSGSNGAKLRWHECDHTERAIKEVVDLIAAEAGELAYVFICTGILHGDNLQPEKRLEDLDASAFHAVMQVNCVIPLLWLKHLVNPLSSQALTRVVVFSARVGSIADNRLGGWYSYRISKASLNMGLKTAAIEYGRRASGVKLVAFHPGTTDTPLSRPFQRNVPDHKLFRPGYVADRLWELLQEQKPDGELSYLDWQGQPIDW